MKKLVLVVWLKDVATMMCVVSLFALALLFATQAEARLINPKLPILTETHHEAIHLPTGCSARVVIDQRDFVRAAITDPKCLPKGVASRTVPGSRFDFEFVSIPKGR